MKHPWKPSYLRNQGVITRAQRRTLRSQWPKYGVTLIHGHMLCLDTLFGRAAPTLVDIGFGRGESLVAVALARPDWNILGVEVHKPGIAWALRSIDEQNLQNVRIVRADVLWLFEQFLDGPVFQELRVFFPEPWPRSPERRLIRDQTLPIFAKRCHVGATWRIATDDFEYAEHAGTVLERFPFVIAAESNSNNSRCSDRPETVYEAKGKEAGRTIVDFHYRLTSNF